MPYIFQVLSRCLADKMYELERNKEIKFFMLVGAPLIVGALCGIKNVFPTKIIIQNETASSSESLQPNLIEKISQSQFRSSKYPSRS